MRRYPKVGYFGGKIIRNVIALLRMRGIQLPITSHILIACSGGADSIALAHLLVHFGRHVIKRSNCSILHINHHWRDADADRDEAFVVACANDWQIPVQVMHLNPNQSKTDQSLEAVARQCRKRIFRELALQKQASIFTAHHADDLAETMIWRLFTGRAMSHGGGVLIKNSNEIRPLLRIRKNMLKAYLQEVGLPWCEDSTNQDLRFLRSRLRKCLMPVLEEIFPRSVEHLVEVALKIQCQDNEARSVNNSQEDLFDMRTVRLSKVHWQMLKTIFESHCDGTKQFVLPNGWRLVHEKQKATN